MKAIDVFRLTLLGAIWGSSYLFMKVVVPVIGVSLTVSSRIVIAAVLMLALFGLSGNFPQFRKYWQQYLVLGLLNLVLPFAMITWSMLHINASMGAIINATTPLFALAVSAIWLKERITPVKMAGLLLGITGVIFLVGWNPLPFNLSVILSIGMGLGAAACYALASVYTRKKFSGANPKQTSAGQMSAAALMLAPFLFYETGQLSQVNHSILLSVLVLALVCTAFAYTLYFQLIASAGSVKATLVTFLVPIFSLLWAVIFLNEKITAGVLLSLACILTGLYLIIMKK